MLKLIWKNIARRRARSALTVTITMLTVLVFVMVMGIFQIVNQGLSLSRERLGADAVLVPQYSTADGGDLLFTALPENIYMPIETIEQAKDFYKRLQNEETEARTVLYSIADEDRASVILPGMGMLIAAMESFDIEVIHKSENGVREGYLAHYIHHLV